ncbi:hypothetical protein AVEN_33843-1 [Araneus ventricosus]|uniref:Uncharacterized protein n=1 Tax=Araneus ventricosus TaxID=182803 RepID=A0A4Y2J5J2_ARAVE|nr:hypothetical protein AVEN_33843-1 [Araneus ventricosus]
MEIPIYEGILKYEVTGILGENLYSRILRDKQYSKAMAHITSLHNHHGRRCTFIPFVRKRIEIGTVEIGVRVVESGEDGLLNFGLSSEMLICQVLFSKRCKSLSAMS